MHITWHHFLQKHYLTLYLLKYGKEEAAKRIYATTDKEKGALKGLATAEGYESFVVPDDVGGRFSVLTAVGLLPICRADAVSCIINLRSFSHFFKICQK